MITFTCSGCSKLFTVPDSVAGKKAKCKACGTVIEVPAASTVSPSAAPVPDPAAPAPKLTVRHRRLIADAQQMRTKFAGSDTITLVEAQGDAPEFYKVQFNVRSIEKLEDGEPVFREQHLAEIQLPAEYPRLAPKCRLLTPIFHPNIDPTTICVGDHWAAGEQLSDLVIRIAEILAFQAYNIKSPLDGDAAMWADLHAESLPTDGRNFHRDVNAEPRDVNAEP